ncbi:MAG: hypothetical protein IT330_02455 [Anaerolineae bacterium]|nr:hypothetical protein [Anaerolineae bacterium]
MILTRRNSLILFVILSSALLATEAQVAGLMHLAQKPEVLTVAIIADVAIGIPLLYYILLARKKYSPASGVVALYFLSLAAVRFILPLPQQAYLDFVEILAPLGELVALGLVVWRARDIIRRVRQAQANALYFADALRQGIQQSLGRSLFTRLLATEFSLIYFALFGWARRFRLAQPESIVFPYHRQSGYTIVFYAMLFIVIVEAAALHFLIQLWSAPVAWAVTALNLYALLWMLGYYQSARLQPMVLTPTHLHLRTGFQWRAEIPLAHIAEVRRATFSDRKAEGYLNVAVFGEPRLVLRLKEPALVMGFFGKTQAVSLLGITVDDEKAFVTELNKRLTSTILG